MTDKSLPPAASGDKSQAPAGSTDKPAAEVNKETVTSTPDSQPNKDVVNPGAVADKFYDKSPPPPAQPPGKGAPVVNDNKDKGAPAAPKSEAGGEAGKVDSSDAAESKTTDTAEKLALPENALIGKESLDEIEALRVAQGLSVATAQEFLNRENKAVTQYVDTQKKFFEEKQSDIWYEELKNHKTLGGDHFAENAENAKRFVQQYCTASVKKILNDTAWGNNPVLFEIFSAAGKSMANDRHVSGSTGKVSSQAFEDKFYGSGKDAQE